MFPRSGSLINVGHIVSNGSLPRGCAMSERILWFPVIAILIFFGTGTSVPALARDANGIGVAGRPFVSPMHAPRPSIVRVPPSIRGRVVAPHIIARKFGVQNGFRFDHNARLLRGPPIAISPFSPFFGTAFSPFFGTVPIQVPLVASDAPSSPVVIVMSGFSDRAPERAAPETPPDYGYVAGCHAIPNGYHCDIPPTEAKP
jgi:hypothetical protein